MKRQESESGQARIVILALVCFLTGLAGGAFCFSRKAPADLPSQGDVSEASAPVASVSPQPQSLAPVDPAVVDAVKHAIPNVKSASLEEGTRILREAAVNEFLQTVQELQTRQKEVQQNFIQGQNNQSEEQQQIATKQLRELQAEQTEKLKQIAAKSRARIDAFQQLKGIAH